MNNNVIEMFPQNSPEQILVANIENADIAQAKEIIEGFMNGMKNGIDPGDYLRVRNALLGDTEAMIYLAKFINRFLQVV